MRGALSPRKMKRVWARAEEQMKGRAKRQALEAQRHKAGQQKRKEQEDEHKKQRLARQKAKYRFATAPRTGSQPVAEAANSSERVVRDAG